MVCHPGDGTWLGHLNHTEYYILNLWVNLAFMVVIFIKHQKLRFAHD